MEQLIIPGQQKMILQDFAQCLKDLYKEGLVSVILYGSAASGEFVQRHSNLNVLIVLKNTDLATLKKSSKLLRKSKMVEPLFLSEEYIAHSTDVFPIEFMDIQENYFVIYGKDCIQGLHIDLSNLRFQCESELKAKLIRLRQAYVMLADNSFALRRLLFSSCTSVLHIARNVLRVQGIKPPYLKHEVLKELGVDFKIDTRVWEKILSAKNEKIVLKAKEVEQLFLDFVKELETIVSIVDSL